MQINAVYGYGSTGIIVKDLRELSKEKGIYGTVACQTTTVSDENIYQIGNKYDWKIHALLTRIFGKQGYASRFTTKQFLKFLDEEKPDIVHLHNLHANYINLNMLLLYLAKKNISTVLTLHDCWFFTGKCFHFVGCGCEKWKTGCGDCPQNKEDVKSLFFDCTKSVFRDKEIAFQAIPNLTVVGCSDWIKGLAKQSSMFAGKKITRIYNGVDTSVFYQRDSDKLKKKNMLENKFVILGMANKWLKKENTEIVKKLIENLSDDDRVVIVGCTDQQKKELKKYSQVLTFGFITDRNTLADIYSSADVFVNMTFEDTLPTVNMEAICCGTPVITYNSCGSPELVRTGVTGYVISQKSECELFNALYKVKNGLIDRDKCAAEGVKRFDKTSQYQKYIRLYQNIVEGRR